MDETKADMDVETEQKDNKIQFLEDKIGIAGSKSVEEMKRLGLDKTSSRKKLKQKDKSMKKLNKTLNSHLCIKKPYQT